MHKLLLYFHTLKYLKPIQVFYQLFYRVMPTKIITKSKYAFSHKYHKPELKFIEKKVNWKPPFEFEFLNLSSSPNNWNDESHDKLWLYNLHYFDVLADKSHSHSDKNALIDKWIKENPAPLGNGWEPYPTSLRLVNWVKFFLSCKKVPESFLTSMAIQAEHLENKIEYHLLGNHYLANIKALIFFYLYSDCKKNLSIFLTKLEKQLNEQIKSDGSHFENSPMYHCIILEDLLDLIEIFTSLDLRAPTFLTLKAQNSVDYLVNITFPDDTVPHFNDSTDGIAQKPSVLLKKAKKLGLKECKIVNFINNKNSGVFKSSFNNSVLMVDGGNIGPNYIPGHAHADNTTYELMLNKEKIITDTSISSYQSIERRMIERASYMHNVLTINEQNTSQIWGAFRVAKRATSTLNKISNSKNNNKISIYHSGYPFKVTRDIAHSESFLEITDSVDSIQDIETHIHFNKDVTLKEVSNKEIVIITKDYNYKLTHNAERQIIQYYELCLGFNTRVKAHKLTLSKSSTSKIHYKIYFK